MPEINLEFVSQLRAALIWHACSASLKLFTHENLTQLKQSGASTIDSTKTLCQLVIADAIPNKVHTFETDSLCIQSSKIAYDDDGDYFWEKYILILRHCSTNISFQYFSFSLVFVSFISVCIFVSDVGKHWLKVFCPPSPPFSLSQAVRRWLDLCSLCWA